MPAPLVSVIIPVYNAAQFLRCTLDSVLAQTYPAVEVVVVDDGSEDGSHALLRSYGDRLRVFRQENAGSCRARNLGFRRSRGDFIALLDHDDVLEPPKIARQVELLRQYPDDDLAVCDGIEFDADKILNRHLFHPDILREINQADNDGISMELYRAFLAGQPIWTFGQTLMRRPTFEHIGPICEEPDVAPDHEWYLRLAGAGGTFRFHPERHLRKRYSAASRSGELNRRPLHYAQLSTSALLVHRQTRFVPDADALDSAIRRYAWRAALLSMAFDPEGSDAEQTFRRSMVRRLHCRYPSHPGIRLANRLVASRYARFPTALCRTLRRLRQKFNRVRPLAR